MENNSTLEKVLLVYKRKGELLRSVGTTSDYKVTFLSRMMKENLIILKTVDCFNKIVFIFGGENKGKGLTSV